MNQFEVESVNDITVEVSGLSGLDDCGPDLSRWYRQMAGNIAARARNQPKSGADVRAQIQKAVQNTLKVPPAAARDVMSLATKAPVQLNANSINSAEGARALANAGKRAQAATRLSYEQSRSLERQIRKLAAKARTSNPAVKARLDEAAALLTRELVAANVKSQRAAMVSGAILTGLKYREQAAKAKTAAEHNLLMMKARMAIHAGQVSARTQIAVQVPKVLSSSAPAKMLESVKNIGPRPGSAFAAEVQSAHALPNLTMRGGMPAFPNAPAQPKVGTLTRPTGLPSTPTLVRSDTRVAVEVNENKVVASLRGLDGLGFFDQIINAAKQIIPAHTIVGKALNGNVGGAVTGAVQYASTAIAANQPPPAQPPVQQQVQQDIATNTGSILPGGMRNPFSNLPGWVIPAGLAAAAAGVALWLL